jgi:hypothetical protein
MSDTTTIGLDIAKHVFQVHGVAADGTATVKRRLRRSEVIRFFDRLPRCRVGLEACGGAHFWAREITALGHDVRLIPAAYVKPYVKRGNSPRTRDYVVDQPGPNGALAFDDPSSRKIIGLLARDPAGDGRPMVPESPGSHE